MPVQHEGIWWDKFPGGEIRRFDGKGWHLWKEGDPGPQPPNPFPDMPAATVAERRRIIRDLRNSDGRFSLPFNQGSLVSNIAGGDWNTYVQIVLNMVIADTLLDIQGQLAELNQTMKAGAPTG